MIRRIWHFGFLLAVPITGFDVAEGSRGYFNSELLSALRSQYPAAPQDAFPNLYSSLVM